MNNFDFQLPTMIHFGRGAVSHLKEETLRYGKKAFFVYGGSVKKNGLYDQVTQAFQEAGVQWEEFTGVEPNPRHTTVNRGIAALRAFGADCIVAAGGGSTLDCAKAISFGFYHDGDLLHVLYAYSDLGPEPGGAADFTHKVVSVGRHGARITDVRLAGQFKKVKLLSFGQGTAPVQQRPYTALLNGGKLCPGKAFGVGEVGEHAVQPSFKQVVFQPGRLSTLDQAVHALALLFELVEGTVEV